MNRLEVFNALGFGVFQCLILRGPVGRAERVFDSATPAAVKLDDELNDREKELVIQIDIIQLQALP
jgi:hypothetical protein